MKRKSKGNRMITVENDFEVAESKTAGEIDPGTAFVGTIEDSQGEEQTGLFFRTSTGVILVEDPGVEFDSFDEGDTVYSPAVEGYKTADVTVHVDDAY
jgi:hypothetical protein